jgi:hypothetical protein
MKRVFLSFLLLLLTCSITNAKAIKFSMIKINEEYTRASLINYETSKQVEIFRSLPNEQKLNLYKSKFDYLKSINYFNDDETKFIDKIFSNIDESIYSISISDELIQSYKNQATSNQGWKEVKWIILFETLYTPNEFISKIKSNENNNSENITNNPNGKGTAGWCHCKWSWICFPESCDTSSDCDGQGGCGFLGIRECTGRCGGTIANPGNDIFKDLN